MTKRLYVVLDKTTGNEELVEAGTKAAARGMLWRDRLEAHAAKPGDVARLYDAGKRPIREEAEQE